jgi:outer membrane protein OmpA-like peptidoglycan-associated protein
MNHNQNIFKQTAILCMMLLTITSLSNAQELVRPQPKFWFGVSGAADLNFFTGTTQTLNSEVKAPTAFHDGFGVSPYASLLMEYRPDPVWGFMLNLAYDSRGAKFDDVIAPCNCPATLKTNLAYLSLEPSLRIAPFANDFYMFIGAIGAYNISKSFTYTQELQTDKKGDLSDVNSMVFSGQIGLGYEIPLASKSNAWQFNLSPFISYHPYFGREPRSIESLSISTLRIGAAFKLGRAKIAEIPVTPVVVPEPILNFMVTAPISIPGLQPVRETLPLRDYVFFDEGSTAIPNRYTLLNKDAAKNFKEIQLQDCKLNPGTRSSRQLAAYYQILNITGDRMRANPSSTITLIGSSAGKGPELGLAYANSVKAYLVNNFGISESRIKTDGRDMPIIPSTQPGGTKELDLLNAGDRRVDIVSTSPELMLQVKDESPLCLRPLEITSVNENTLNEQVNIDVNSNGEALKTWSLEIKGPKGNSQFYGPFTSVHESISAQTILKDNESGKYTMILVGENNKGSKIRQEKSFELKREKDKVTEELRYSILFDFDKSKSAASYEKFLNEVIAPLVQNNGTVVIHGHTDIIGDKNYNEQLSKDRAEETHIILEKAISKLGKTGVKYKIEGFGTENPPFANALPEERFYNRTVVIDVIPAN